MAFPWTPRSLFSEGPTVEHIEYALPTPTSTTTNTNPTYHHTQHYLPNGSPGPSSTHIEYADDPTLSRSFPERLHPTTTPRRPATTPAQPQHDTGNPPTPNYTTTPSTSPSSPASSPTLHVRFAGDLPIPRRLDVARSPSPSPSPPHATVSGSASASASRTGVSPRGRSRASSPYPVLVDSADTHTHMQGGGVGGGERGGAPEGGWVASVRSSRPLRVMTVARTAFVDREEVWDESGFMFEEEGEG